jgi:signal transduction histidine kinase
MGIPRTLSATISTDNPTRFGVALLATVLALLIGWALNPFLGGAALYLLAIAAVAFTARYCGTGPSIVFAVLSALAIDFWLIPPSHSLHIARPQDWLDLLAFLLVACVVVIIGDATRRERDGLLVAAGQMEEKVRDRTNELDLANESLRELTARLLNLQDEERRRIARELHDNAGQALSVLALNLGVVSKELERVKNAASTVAETAELVHQMSDDIRTTAYLLHPPLLDEAGLVSAVQWYVEGFSQRSKIAVECDCDENLARLPAEVETAVFRVIQECLTNIHRHSGSPTASIQIAESDGQLLVEVRDNGKGLLPEYREKMAAGATVGVGIRGMRERVRQLGGSLEIISDGLGVGTRVVVRLPVTPDRLTIAKAV